LVFSTEKSTVINDQNQKIRSLAAYGSYHCFFMLKRQFRQAASNILLGMRYDF
jgi:hypothetical protein